MNIEFYTEIQTRLNSVLPNLYVRLWRNQFAELENGDNYSFPFPCCFVEFILEGNVQLLGNGVQVYDPLIVRLHIGSFEPDNGMGTLDQNTNILTLKQQIFTTLQKWKSTKSGIFNRNNEIMHTEHDQVSVWIQDYKCVLVDDTMQEPVSGVVKQPVTGLGVVNGGNIVLNAITLQNGSNLITQSGIVITI
jgi:hypothetical protein